MALIMYQNIDQWESFCMFADGTPRHRPTGGRAVSARNQLCSRTSDPF